MVFFIVEPVSRSGCVFFTYVATRLGKPPVGGVKASRGETIASHPASTPPLVVNQDMEEELCEECQAQSETEVSVLSPRSS